MYDIAQWYVRSEASIPLTIGVSFSPDYARSLGLNPKKTMSAPINELHVRQFRLMSYWDDIEPTRGHFTFSQLDWEFKQADIAHAKVTLTVGLRQPRWPECHPPNWVNTEKPYRQWLPELETYMSAVINRYKHNPALQAYQLENEYFLKAFGTCKNFSRQRLIDEYHLVKSLDSRHPVIISRSNNAIGIPVGKPTPDIFGISIYRRVRNTKVLPGYFEYPIPAWYYAFLAGIQKTITGRDMIIDEMQAEPWPAHGASIPATSLAEQNKTLNPNRLRSRFTFAESTGMRTIDMWGAEYWYYRKQILHDPSVWNAAKQEIARANKL